jgi:bifunctional enzyme CysN/CysC
MMVTLQTEAPLRIVIVGHVDHGKSTFVGRLLHDTDSLPVGKREAIEASCRKRGVEFEWAFLMDALQSERDQNITIDTSQIWFKTAKRPYVIIDAPGHKEFLKNMVTGAAAADAALLCIAANEGVQEQSRRHGTLLSLLGIRQVAVLVNKMDLAGYSQSTFEAIEAEYRAFLKKLGVEPRAFLPMAARHGDNLVAPSPKMPWFRGSTVLQALDSFEAPQVQAGTALRFPVQDVYRFDHRRILAGRVEAGSVQVGDRLVFSPGGKSSTVASIERWSLVPGQTAPERAEAGESVGLTLTEQIFVERGHVASLEGDQPVVSQSLKANLFWLGKRPLAKGRKYKLKLATQEIEVEVKEISRVLDSSTLDSASGPREQVERNEVAELVLAVRRPVALDNHERFSATGRFVLVDERDVAGGGILKGNTYLDPSASSGQAPGVASTNLTRNVGGVGYEDRLRRNGHGGAVVWFTGLSGSGKSTLANALERELMERGLQAYLLDGDNLRYGLNRDLRFSAQDRTENIRRAAEVAGLFADAACIVLTAFISPFREDRRRAREIVSERKTPFLEVFVDAPLEVCEERDPKNLYGKARRGEIAEFTGISSPYEEPEKPELVLRTAERDVEACVTQVLDLLLPLVRVKKS